MPLTQTQYQQIANAKIFMDENYHASISLEQIAKQALMSRYHFHRLFTRIYKLTPHQYITRVRMDAARVLLAKEGISVTEVCTEIGFESLGSFSTLFTRENGSSPQYYRNIAWLKKKLASEQPKRFVPHCFVEQFKVGE